MEVLFIDTDYHFDLLRLVTVLEHRLSQSSEEAIKFCLGRFFLLYCSSSSQLLLTLHSLEALFCGHPSLCLLIVDSLSAFYWTDRANGGESPSLQESTLKQCSQLLDRLVRDYHLLLFATTQSIMQKASDSAEGPPEKRLGEESVDYRPYLCKAWRHVVRHRVLFFREDSPKSSSRFMLVSRHLKSNRLQKHFFMIKESGVEFC